MERHIPKRKRKIPAPKDARVRRNRESLRNALLSLLEATPFENITIRDITAEADVGYTTYFRHYPNKDALLDDVAFAEIDRMTELTLPLQAAGDTRAACLTLCAFVDEHRAVWAALLTGGAAAMVRKEMLRQSREITATHRTRQRSWLPEDLSNVLSISSMVEMLTWWLRQQKPISVAQAADILNRVAIMPVLAAAADKAPAKPRRAKTRRR